MFAPVEVVAQRLKRPTHARRQIVLGEPVRALSAALAQVGLHRRQHRVVGEPGSPGVRQQRLRPAPVSGPERTDTPGRSSPRESRTAPPALSHRLNRIGLPGGSDRAHRPIPGTAPPVQPRAHTGQHLDHVTHHILGALTGVGHHDATTLRGQRRLQVLHPEAGQPVPMLHNDHRGIWVRQNPAKPGAFPVQSGAGCTPTDRAHSASFTPTQTHTFASKHSHSLAPNSSTHSKYYLL